LLLSSDIESINPILNGVSAYFRICDCSTTTTT
jgi:hypothetical protein